MDARFEAFGNPENKVIEECSEVIQAICKLQRFGPTNYHPDRPSKCNAKEVLDELEDLRRAINCLEPILRCYVSNFEERPSAT